MAKKKKQRQVQNTPVLPQTNPLSGLTGRFPMGGLIISSMLGMMVWQVTDAIWSGITFAVVGAVTSFFYNKLRL